MYLEYFGLRQFPFNNTPDTSLFYEGGNRGAILEALIFAIQSGEGIVKVVGEVGSGKTMLCRMAANRLPDHVELVFLLNPSLSPDNIFHAIASELKIPLPGGSDRLCCLQILHDYLLKKHGEGRQVVVFIEEAQGMPLATLEEVRLLSNLETKTHKLLQIILFGQPELDEKLTEHSIRQLRERISNAFSLPPLQTGEIGDYLTYRLWSAGMAGPTLFSLAAVREIARISGGVLRRVNILAHKSLLAAYVNNTRVVGRTEVRTAARDSEMVPDTSGTWPAWLTPAVASALSLAAGIVLSQYLWQSGAVASPAPPQSAVAPLPAVREETVATPPREESRESPPPVLEPVTVAEPVPSAQLAEQTVSEPPAPTTTAAPTQPPREESAPRPPLPEMMLDGLSLLERVRITERWLATSPANRFSLQLMVLNARAIDPQRSLKKLYRDVATDLNVADLRIFQLRNNRYVVYYGDYGSMSEANGAVQALPDYLRRSNPYPKSLGSLRKEMARIAWFQG